MPDLPTVFTRSEARAAGLSDRVLAGPQVQRVFRGVFVRQGTRLTTRLRTIAAVRIAPTGAVVARQTAAELMGGVVPDETRIHLRLKAGRMRVPGIVATVRPMPSLVARVHGITTTTAEDTFVDLVPDLGLVDLVVLGDSLVRRKRTTPARLVRAAQQVRGRHRALAVRAAGLVRDRVDSPMESRLRMLLVLAGLPEPVVDHREEDEDGYLLRRYDLSFPQVRLAIEYDGRQHAESDRQWERDVERREELDREGWRIVVVLGKGIYREPERTLERVVAAMNDRGMPARVTSQEWRVHFPGRDRA
jgi:hypothetical protein